MISLQDAIRCRTMRSTRLVVGLFASFTVLMILVYSSFYSGYQVNILYQSQSSLFDVPGNLINTPTCRIPDFDPMDPLVLRNYFSWPVLSCPKAPPFFIKPLVKGFYTVPHVDEQVLWRYYRLKKQNLRCTYQVAVRDERMEVPDAGFQLVNETALKFGEFVDAEYLWIECFRYSMKTKFYAQPLLLARAKGDSMFDMDKSNSSAKPYNVIVLGYDSVSRLGFHRQLQKTDRFLQDRPDTVIELLGYNKVGLNSSPSQVPLLSGHRFRPRGLYEGVKHNFVDNMTRYIWEDFSDAGYSTMFFEEQWDYGLFVWPELKGFAIPPTDYWPRPIIQMIDGSSIKVNKGSGICVGPKPAAAIYLDYILDLLRTSRKPLWLYPWFSELSHNDLTGASRADGLFANFLARMDKEDFLETTIIFFISDHGFRFGDLRHTPLGRYEDQLPFGFIMVPRAFAEKRPEAIANLRANARRLVTTYDLHATMLELAMAGRTRPPTRTEHGYSLFSELVPLTRTCADAQIDFEFCSCFGVVDQPVGTALAMQLGQAVVNEINNELERHNDTKCVRWKLGTVSQALQLKEGSRVLNVYRVSVDTIPTGKFEATIAVDPKLTPELKLLSGIDRTDWFSKHAQCAMPSAYDRLCYCK
ncbi:hypothetical protein BIW11_01884 [Tropilaelaps mercedesae]|uniref:Uncharacterized protein n=1 Tax=Tropilaelaps mercedesae TaxID=418985 RepID=A0A1V9X6K9_9ACAR|nr:hypothetical protein BIW11_01884 [Tropilaelaps mercedesae]